MKISEAHLQAIVMNWAMVEKHHRYVLPNSNSFFHPGLWESDLISVTSAGLCHEFEIKISHADYLRDAKKRKHLFLGDDQLAPAYFWYVTFGFEIEPPEKAGWISIHKEPSKEISYTSYYGDPKKYIDYGWKLEIKKEAPRLNTWKISEKDKIQIAHLLSWRMEKMYRERFTHNKDML